MTFPLTCKRIGSGRDAEVFVDCNAPDVIFKKGDGNSVSKLEFDLGEAANRICPYNCPRVFDFFQHQDGDSVISQERIYGSTLNASLPSISDLCQIIDVYWLLMQGGVYQNDLKAANVIRSTDGHFYIIDFGISTTSTEDSVEHLCTMASLLLQSILFSADGIQSHFSVLQRSEIRTRYIESIIYGTVAYLRTKLNDNFLKVFVNLRNDRILETRLTRFMQDYNNGRVIANVAPEAPRCKKARTFYAPPTRLNKALF
jgi:serine/threonine protein kinase